MISNFKLKKKDVRKRAYIPSITKLVDAPRIIAPLRFFKKIHEINIPKKVK